MEDRAHEGGNDDERREYPRENRSEQRKIEKVRPTLQAGYVIPEIGLGDISLGDAVRELRPIDHAVDPRNQYSGAAKLPIIRDSWSIRSKSFISMSVKALSSTKPQLENDAPGSRLPSIMRISRHRLCNSLRARCRDMGMRRFLTRFVLA